MNDALLRGRLLTFFNDCRDNAGGWVPTSDINLSGGEPVTLQTIGRLGRELADANLIRWKPLIGAQEGFVVGMAQITGHGTDVVQGKASSSIAIEFPSNAPQSATATEANAQHPLAGISPARIAIWEQHGVEAIEADLINRQGLTYVGGPPGTNEQAWRWVRYKRAQQQSPKPEIFTLKPSLYGITFDVKEALKRFCRWWQER